jgi:hypothetical protein
MSGFDSGDGDKLAAIAAARGGGGGGEGCAEGEVEIVMQRRYCTYVPVGM